MRNTIRVIIGQGFSREKCGKRLVECNKILGIFAALGLVLIDKWFRHFLDILNATNGRQQGHACPAADHIGKFPSCHFQSLDHVHEATDHAVTDRDCVRRSYLRSSPALK